MYFGIVFDFKPSLPIQKLKFTPTMKKHLIKFYALAMLLGSMSILISCSDDDDADDPQPASIVGTWTYGSTSLSITVDGMSFVDWLVSQGTPQADAEALGALFEESSDVFGEATFTFNEDGTMTATEGTEVSDGTYSVNADNTIVTITAEGETLDFNIKTLSESALILSYEESETDPDLGASITISLEMSFTR